MNSPIDPPASETAAGARDRYDQLCQRLSEQKSLRESLRSDYTALYNGEIAIIRAMKSKLDGEKEG